MPQTFRVAHLNVENLFSRPKLLNFADKDAADVKLGKVQELRTEPRKATYDKPKILKLYKGLKDYITIMEVRNKLLSRDRKKVVAGGRDDTVAAGSSSKRERFSDQDQQEYGQGGEGAQSRLPLRSGEPFPCSASLPASFSPAFAQFGLSLNLSRDRYKFTGSG